MALGLAFGTLMMVIVGVLVFVSREDPSGLLVPVQRHLELRLLVRAPLILSPGDHPAYEVCRAWLCPSTRVAPCSTCFCLLGSLSHVAILQLYYCYWMFVHFQYGSALTHSLTHTLSLLESESSFNLNCIIRLLSFRFKFELFSRWRFILLSFFGVILIVARAPETWVFLSLHVMAFAR